MRLLDDPREYIYTCRYSSSWQGLLAAAAAVLAVGIVAGVRDGAIRVHLARLPALENIRCPAPLSLLRVPFEGTPLVAVPRLAAARGLSEPAGPLGEGLKFLNDVLVGVAD
jgi:hypothetical protein